MRLERKQPKVRPGMALCQPELDRAEGQDRQSQGQDGVKGGDDCAQAESCHLVSLFHM